MEWIKQKQTQVVLFSSTAIALYGYDQGMMSLINTNYNYLETMGISEEDPMVGVIVSIYYLGAAVGAVLASKFADAYGRKPGVLICVATAAAGSLIMFISGMGFKSGAIYTMLIGRVVMGLGVGGLDSVVPVYTSELSEDDARGTALAQEFQANILGLNLAFIINIAVTYTLGKYHEWAWRTPIVCMQIFPILLLSGTALLPETPRWLVLHGKDDQAKTAISKVFGKDQVDSRFKELQDAHAQEEKDGLVSYADMIIPGRDQFHPTVVTVMGQVNQALTGYGAVSVYGPQIFELLGFKTSTAEFITLGNYLFYFGMMTFAWLLIDRKGRRYLLVNGAIWLSISFALLTVLGGLATNREEIGSPLLATGIPGIVVLYLATSVFGIGWLVPPWLIPTEIYPSSARANGAAISVVVWGLANFAVTLLTPILFNNLAYWLFLIFAGTNAFAGLWTWLYCPESGTRTFEENQEFFKTAADEGSWNVRKVDGGKFLGLPDEKDDGEEGGQQGENGNNKKKKDKKNDGQQDEREPLLSGSD